MSGSQTDFFPPKRSICCSESTYPFLVNDLRGKVALISGSSRGIGRAISLVLAESGADIALNFRSRSEDAQAVESQILQLGRRCITVQADVSVASDVERLVRS